MTEEQKVDLKKVLEKVAQYRGVIITDSINIERFMEAIIINYFVKEEKSSEFLVKCITDEYFSFGLKIRILEKLELSTYDSFFEDIRRLNKIRNIFAHCSPGTFTGGLSYYNEKNKSRETKELEEFHKEFLAKIKKVQPQLEKIFNEIIKSKNGPQDKHS